MAYLNRYNAKAARPQAPTRSVGGFENGECKYGTLAKCRFTKRGGLCKYEHREPPMGRPPKEKTVEPFFTKASSVAAGKEEEKSFSPAQLQQLRLKHQVSGEVILTPEQQKQWDDIQNSEVVVKVPNELKRALGMKTRSMKMGLCPGDGIVYSDITAPPGFAKPSGDQTVVLKITQDSIALGFLSTSAAVPVAVAASFNVNSLDQISSLTSVFDQYRITKIDAWLTPQTAMNSNTNVGEIVTVIDVDDDTALGSFAQGLDYQNCVVASGALGQKRSFVPHAAYAVYSGVFTSFGNVPSPWIDAASTTVKHYGLKIVSTVTSAVQVYDLHYRLHTEWKSVR